jgi:hypothetical protein
MEAFKMNALTPTWAQCAGKLEKQQLNKDDFIIMQAVY